MDMSYVHGNNIKSNKYRDVHRHMPTLLMIRSVLTLHFIKKFKFSPQPDSAEWK